MGDILIENISIVVFLAIILVDLSASFMMGLFIKIRQKEENFENREKKYEIKNHLFIPISLITIIMIFGMVVFYNSVNKLNNNVFLILAFAVQLLIAIKTTHLLLKASFYLPLDLPIVPIEIERNKHPIVYWIFIAALFAIIILVIYIVMININ